MDASDKIVGQILRGNGTSYIVQRFLGEGSFGMVVEGLNLFTNEHVAIKMLKDPAAIKEAEMEVRMLERIGTLDSQRCNMVQLRECFQHKGLTCLVFEMLDISLYDHILESGMEFCLSELRTIAKQLLEAFDALKDLDVIHADLKPDNIMYTDRTLAPHKVKLIDFGLARPISEVRQGQMKQPKGFRAPEVSLGCVFDAPIDMWGLGCTLATLLLGENLFPVSCYQSMKMMVELLGMPSDIMLQNGGYTHRYFKKEDNPLKPTWRLMTPDEYRCVTRRDPGQPEPPQDYLRTIDDLVNVFVTDDPVYLEDLKVFVDFLKGLLTVDPRLRLTPKEALQHPFITMARLEEDDDYSKMSKYVMRCVYPSESPIHHDDQPPASSDDVQHKASSPVSSRSATASEGIFVKAVDPFSQASGLHEAWRSSSSEEGHYSDSVVTSTSSDQSSLTWTTSQLENDYINKYFDEGSESSFSEASSPVSSPSEGSLARAVDALLQDEDSCDSDCSNSSEEPPLNVALGQILRGNGTSYFVQRFLGEGSFGMVVEGLNSFTNERVAIKMLKDPAAIKEAEMEVRMLERIGTLDSQRCNMVQLRECFQHKGLTCLVFEMLDISLFDHVAKHNIPLSVSELRTIAKQLLEAFDALKDLGVIHADLKPDNIMYTDRTLAPHKVKLIDFGLARPISEVRQGQMKQPKGYRAPEVSLGCVFDAPIDMWGLGCTLASLLLGENLFPVSCYQSMKMMVELLGMPSDIMLQNGGYTHQYFKKEDNYPLKPTWRLMTPDEYRCVNRRDPGQPKPLQDYLRTIDDLVDVFATDDPVYLEDLKVFVDFLKGLLTVDPKLRLTPKEALQHPFITMARLGEDDDYSMMSKYVMRCVYPSESPVHHDDQPPASPDNVQHKASSLVSSRSATASEVIFVKAVDPFSQASGLHEAGRSSSSEEGHYSDCVVTSTPADQSFLTWTTSQLENEYIVHINNIFGEGSESSFSEASSSVSLPSEGTLARAVDALIQDEDSCDSDCSNSSEEPPLSQCTPYIDSSVSQTLLHFYQHLDEDFVTHADVDTDTDESDEADEFGLSQIAETGQSIEVILSLGHNSERIEMNRALTLSKNPKPNSYLDKRGPNPIDYLTWSLDVKADKKNPEDKIFYEAHDRCNAVSSWWILSWIQSLDVAQEFVILVWDPGGKKRV